MVKPDKGLSAQRIGPPPGMNARAMEHLIGIDVTDSGQKSLIQEQRFDRPVF
jgi:hypothetical protein